MSERMFPVLWSMTRLTEQNLTRLGCPRSVPWSLLAPHEDQAKLNHSQSLQRLAERGGLSPAEMIAVIEGHDLRWILNTTDEQQVPRLLEMLSAVLP